MATVTVILKKHRAKDNGTFPICIRVTDGSKSRYKYIGHSVKVEQFKSGISDWVKKHPDALFINSLIEDERNRIQEKITRLKLDRRPFDFDYIISDTPAEGHTLSEILDIIANQFFNNEDISRGNRHTMLKNQVKECLGRDYLMKELTYTQVCKIEAHFRTKEGNNSNTTAKKISLLRTAFNIAKKTWIGELGDNPFDLIKVKGEPVKRIKLKPEQIQAIEELPLVGFIDVSRDAFLFSYYAQGMRFGNVITLTRDKINLDGINYRMSKGHHERELEMHPKLRRIIEKYINNQTPYLFPILKSLCKTKTQSHYAIDSANTIVNTCLERIGYLIGLPVKLTFHITKHSYAQMLKKAGVDPWVIKDSLGHTDFRTTEAYLDSLDDDHINKAVTGLY